MHMQDIYINKRDREDYIDIYTHLDICVKNTVASCPIMEFGRYTTQQEELVL